MLGTWWKTACGLLLATASASTALAGEVLIVSPDGLQNFDEIQAAGFTRLAPGVMGENVTTRGIDLLALPAGARLRLGDEAVVEVPGLRNPCRQLDGIEAGLMDATLDRDEAGEVVRKAGIMGVVVTAGTVAQPTGTGVRAPPRGATFPGP